jgi:uncharacterized protein YkwD
MRQFNQLSRIFFKSTLVLLLLPCSFVRRMTAESTVSGSSVSGSSASVAEQYLLAAANRERLSRGLQPLQRDPVLAGAAAFHAQQMADRGDISHEFPGEPDLAARASNAGVHFSLVAENVAVAPEPTAIHDMWMKSEGHRENLLDPHVNVAGISVVLRDGQFYAVEDFASTVKSMTFDQQESTVASLIAASGIDVANQATGGSDIRTARATCTTPSGYAGTRKPWFVMRYTASTLDALPSDLKSRIGSGKYHQAAVGACSLTESGSFSEYNIAVLLYP